MKLHFCEACGRKFDFEGDLPPGPALCDACRQKQGLPVAVQPRRSGTTLRSAGRSNTGLRASGMRAGRRERFGGATAGTSSTALWAGLLGLLAVAGILTFILLRYVGSSEEPERPNPPPEKREHR